MSAHSSDASVALAVSSQVRQSTLQLFPEEDRRLTFGEVLLASGVRRTFLTVLIKPSKLLVIPGASTQLLTILKHEQFRRPFRIPISFLMELPGVNIYAPFFGFGVEIVGAILDATLDWKTTSLSISRHYNPSHVQALIDTVLSWVSGFYSR